MKVYDWGEEFFNGYDSLYVSKTHTYFNVKLNSESWSDIYNFDPVSYTHLTLPTTERV